MSPRSHKELAREHLDRALEQEEDDALAVVLWLFYAVEHALDALAISHGQKKGNHRHRIRTAATLASEGVVPSGTDDLLAMLNDARLDSAYLGELELGDWTLEDALAAVEHLVELVESETNGD